MEQYGKITTGTWGGAGGKPWTYKPKSGIKQIIIRHGGVIDSIRFKGHNEDYSKRFGGCGGERTVKIEFDFPSEFLVGISGTYGSLGAIPEVIRSLKFYTNLTQYGPYGTTCGTPFSFFAAEGGMITGFQGRFGGYLDAIGLILQPLGIPTSPKRHESEEKNDEDICPWAWGGPGGKDWAYKPKHGITQIIIAHGSVIDSIMFKDSDSPAADPYSAKFGGNGGTRTDKVDIDFPSECLTGIGGTCGVLFCPWDPIFVKSITFYTNKSKYGPFGCHQWGQPFFFNAPKGGIVTGFHGRASSFLDAIGVYIKSARSSSVSSALVLPKRENAEDVINKNHIGMKDVLPRSPGPWGGNGGIVWDDGVFSAVKEVHVHVCGKLNVITGIQFEYEKRDGNTYWSPMHGGRSGDIVKRIVVDGDLESKFFTGICGCFGPVEGSDGVEIIKSLTFITNKGFKYGPLGNEVGDYFTSMSRGNGKIVGFHGRSSGHYLNAIGVFAEYL